LRKTLILIVAAVMLGVTVMLSPIVVFTQQILVSTDSQRLSPVPTYNLTISDTRSLVEAAQTYGKIDAGPEPFQLSLLHAALIAAASFAVALGVLLVSQRKM